MARYDLDWRSRTDLLRHTTSPQINDIVERFQAMLDLFYRCVRKKLYSAIYVLQSDLMSVR